MPPKNPITLSYRILIFLFATLMGCQTKENNSPQTTNKEIAQDTARSFEGSEKKTMDSIATIETKKTYDLVLTSNALQLANITTGSTIEILFL